MHKNQSGETVSRSTELLEEACQQEGCPLCTTLLAAVERYIDGWLYDGFTDGTLRAKLIRTRGFCALHTWQAVQKNARFPLALVYQEALTAFLTNEEQQSQTRVVRSWNRLFFWRRRAGMAPVQEYCHLCQVRDEAEAHLVAAMLDLLRAKQQTTHASFCLAHYTRLLAHAEQVEPAMVAQLRVGQLAATQELLKDTQELLRLYDYRFAHEPQGKERDAWRRAAAFFVGQPGVR
jgi:hypothetical protein